MAKAKIRVGDAVRIVDPQLVVRCGYPMCIKDVVRSLDHEIAILAIKRATGLPEDEHLRMSRRLERIVGRINRELAVAIMISEGFGGSERKIYTEERPELLGKIVKVESKRRVVTGDRYPGCGPGYYGDEAEGPCLENQKHHVIINFRPIFYEVDRIAGAFVHDTNWLEIEQPIFNEVDRIAGAFVHDANWLEIEEARVEKIDLGGPKEGLQ